MTTGTVSARLTAEPRSRRRFEVLVLCTANRCRSPAMEALLRVALDPGTAAWDVRSAGTRAREGFPPHPDTVAVLAEHGLALPPDWTSRRVTADDVARADLVLTATREHRGATVALHPAAASRVYTLRQFARLLQAAGAPSPGISGEHPGEVLVRTAQAGRGVVAPPEQPDDDDLADPIGRPRAAFEQMVADVAASAAVISGVLTAAP